MSYYDHPAANWSTIKWLRESALAYKYRLDQPPADTQAFALGRATHTLVFEPVLFDAEYVIWTGGTRRGKEWDAFRADNEDKTILRDEDADLAVAMADAVRRHPLVQPYLDDGVFEQPVFWTDAETGIACKGKPDWIIPGSKTLLDLKTCRSINGRRFGSEAARFGYHAQLAMYRAGIKAAQGWYADRVLIVAVEKEAPYDVGVFELDFEALYAGEEEIAELLRMLKACRESGRWPGRYTEEQALQLPAWVTMDDDDDPESFGLVAGEQ